MVKVDKGAGLEFHMSPPIKALDLTWEIYEGKGTGPTEIGLGKGIDPHAIGLVPGPTRVCRPYFAN